MTTQAERNKFIDQLMWLFAIAFYVALWFVVWPAALVLTLIYLWNHAVKK